MATDFVTRNEVAPCHAPRHRRRHRPKLPRSAAGSPSSSSQQHLPLLLKARGMATSQPVPRRVPKPEPRASASGAARCHGGARLWLCPPPAAASATGHDGIALRHRLSWPSVSTGLSLGSVAASLSRMCGHSAGLACSLAGTEAPVWPTPSPSASSPQHWWVVPGNRCQSVTRYKQLHLRGDRHPQERTKQFMTYRPLGLVFPTRLACRAPIPASFRQFSVHTGPLHASRLPRATRRRPGRPPSALAGPTAPSSGVCALLCALEYLCKYFCHS